MAYPTGAQLGAWMVSQGLLSAVPGDLTALDSAARSAGTAWESATKWSPFLAGEEETRKFDGPEGRVLYPGVGIVSVTTLTIDGSEIAEDEGFFLQNRYFASSGPYQSLEFDFHVRGVRRCVEILGVFGFASALPYDASEAIYAKGAATVIIDPSFQGVIKSEKKGPVEYEYAISDSFAASTAGRLLSSWSEAVKRYKRWA